MKHFAKILFITFGILALICLSIGAIYFIDEPLNKEVKILLSQNWRDDGSIEENAMYHFAGLKAPIESDAFLVGLKIAELYNKSETSTDFSSEYNKIVSSQSFPFGRNAHSILREIRESKDINILSKYKDSILDQKISSAYILDRLTKLKNTNYYKTPYEPNHLISERLDFEILFATEYELIVNLLEEDKEIAVKATLQDFNDYQKILSQIDRIIPSLQMKNVIYNYFVVLDILISDPTYRKYITQAMLPKKINITDKFSNLFVSKVNNLYSSKDEYFKLKPEILSTKYDKVTGFTYDELSLWNILRINKNRSINIAQSIINEIKYVMNLNSDNNVKAYEDLYSSIDFHYLFFRDLSIYVDYSSYLIDCNTYIELLRLKLKIYLEGISKDEIKSFISIADNNVSNPYTKETIKYDKDKNVLYFIGPIFGEENSKTYLRQVVID